MTFQDDIHRDCEEAALIHTRELKLWLDTISPVNEYFAYELSNKLMLLAELMGWPVHLCDKTGITILGKIE